MIRTCFILSAILLAQTEFVTVSSAQDHQTRPPNIVFIFADDMGWADAGYNGSDFYETPNIDQLKREGMVFANAYASAGNCAPSRACLLSGTYTPRHSVYAVGSTLRGPENLMRLKPIPNKSGLAPSNVTMADALKSAGYATGIFGKWHLGGPDGAPPKAQGFDVVADTYAGAEQGGESRPAAKKKAARPKRSPDDPKGIFSLTQKACDFIETNRDQPFFCYLPHHAIHTALEARPETLAKFRAKQPGAKHNHALYAACLYDLDEGVGILMGKLKELGLERDTLVIFTSDNGGTPQSSQEPLRGNKGGYYEGGIREPFVARWPGVIAPGSVCETPIINVDLYPTFLDVVGAGAHPPEGKTLDGESLLPLFKGETNLKRQAIFWHFPGYLNSPVTRGRDPVFRTRPVSVIRKGDWKLHLYHEEWQLDGGRVRLDVSRAVELYNLAEDIGERHDLASQNISKRDELLDDLLAWIEATKAPMPIEKNPNYNPNPDAKAKPAATKKARAANRRKA